MSEDAPEIEPLSERPQEPEPHESRLHVDADSDLQPVPEEVPEPALEMPDPAPEGEAPLAVGGPDDPSDEHPLLVDDAEGGDEPSSELQLAYECLELRTPIEELQAFARARRETLVRLGEAERAEVAGESLELALRALREVMGAVPARKELP